MLSTRQKISLMCMYMRPVLVVSGFVSIFALLILATVSMELLSDVAFFISFIKMFILVLCIILFINMRSNSSKFFYINLGVPVKKLLLWGVASDLGVFYAGLIIILIVRYGIS